MATEYWIHCVSYGTDPKRIESAGVFEKTPTSTSLEGPTTRTREQVVQLVRNGASTYTTIKKADGKWQRGAVVEAYAVDNEWFIRTDANNTAADNLENLPNC